jgi:hypothetical protein
MSTLDETSLVEHHTSALLVHNCGDIPRSNPFKESQSWKFLPRSIRQTKGGIMCWMANTHITPLHDVQHTDDDRDRLNEHGLYIYLYEPLCSYMLDDDRALGNGFNCGFYSEYPSDFQDWSINRSAELDSISFYAYNNNLTNVHVLTGDYGVAEYYPYYTEQLKLECDDLFLRGLSVFDHITTRKKDKKEITKDFVCTSWRYTPARNVIAALLSKKESHISWFYQVEKSVIDSIQWLDVDQEKADDATYYKELVFGLDRLNQRSPWCLDKLTETVVYVDEPFGHFYPKSIKGFEDYANPVSVNPYKLPLERFYRSAYLDVVCESRFAQPTGNLSEKVFQAIQFKTPFLLVAPPHSLQYMKEMGYKTFDAWWDESYDAEEDHGKRMKMIHRLINEYASLSADEKYAQYEEMWSVLVHNFNLHVKSTPTKMLRSYSAIKWHEIQDKQCVAEEEIDPHTGRPVGWDD